MPSDSPRLFTARGYCVGERKSTGPCFCHAFPLEQIYLKQLFTNSYKLPCKNCRLSANDRNYGEGVVGGISMMGKDKSYPLGLPLEGSQRCFFPVLKK